MASRSKCEKQNGHDGTLGDHRDALKRKSNSTFM